MSNLKRTATALCTVMALSAGSAFAIGDITVVNGSGSTVIAPYFKSNCWNRSFIDQGPDQWIFFGGIAPRTQFNWDHFYGLLDPKCQNPIVKFTYVPAGTEPPHQTVVERTVVLRYDAMENTVIRLGDDVVVQSVATQ